MEQELTHEEKVAKVRELITDIDIAMLTTLDNSGHLHSRPMAVNTAEFDGDVWFFSKEGTPKVAEIQHDKRVNVALSSPKENSYVSLSGRAQIVRDQKKIEELWKPILKAWFPDGPQTPGIVLIKVEVESAEYWDSPSSTIAHAIGLVKSLITHETPKAIGENETVKL